MCGVEGKAKEQTRQHAADGIAKINIDFLECPEVVAGSS